MGKHSRPLPPAGSAAGAAVAVAVARAGLVRALVADGALTDPRWHAAFAAVPRHLFVPYYYAFTAAGYERRACDDPDPRERARWLAGAYADIPLATRVRDGELLSSSSQPSLMAAMLEALDLRDGQRVLEIGAGTGYNAALLSHRLGGEHVTTVDLDPEITGSARAHLAAAGYHPAVVRGDGALGCPARAPYDRIVATCALPSVPPGWLGQCAPGALVLAPLATGLIALRVADAGHAEGRFLRVPAYFLPLRGEGTEEDEGDASAEEGTDADGGAGARAAPSGVPARALRDEPFRFLRALTARSLAPDEAYAVWKRERRPPRERFGVTVRGGRQWAWLDAPDGPYHWPLTR